MDKSFTKSLFFLLVFIFFAHSVFAQVITIGTVDAGPYGPGSTIGVPIQVSSSCIDINNTYNLYLSDASGNFGAQKLIGTFKGSYVTFVNGTLPAGLTAGGGYKVKVVSSSPVATSAASTAFTIGNGTGVVAGLNSQSINPDFPEVFGTCAGNTTVPYPFINKSTAGATVTASFFNELSRTTEKTNLDLTNNGSFSANASNYTITVKAVKDGVVGTYTYMLINNSVVNGFGAAGNSTACLVNAPTMVFNVDLDHTQNNFPGLIYNVSWGDGASSQYTYCQILSQQGHVSHAYTKASCGNTADKNNKNSFRVTLQLISPYCGNVGSPSDNHAKVISPPENLIAPQVAGCLGSPIKFVNNSFPGDDPNSTSAKCTNTSATYTWLVDGVPRATGKKISEAFDYTFTTTGMHRVVLRFEGAALCPVPDFAQDICIQNPPQPKFTIQSSACGPISIKPTNTSVIDSNCNTSNSYVWKVTGPAPVTTTNGTTASSFEPVFNFTKPGVYTVTFGVKTLSCGFVPGTPQTVTINTSPTVQLSPDFVQCASGPQTLSFDPTQVATKTVITGTATPQPGSYTWTVTGGSYSFENSTTANSQYPSIKFNDVAKYTIKVVQKNLCGGSDASGTQTITFQNAPNVSAGGPYPTACSDSPVALTGTVSDLTLVSSVLWTSTGGGTFSAPDQLITNYTPSASEISAGTTTVVLTATTTLPSPCSEIPATANIAIVQPDTITSDSTKTICSGSPLNYTITSATNSSNFTWAVDAANTSASANGYNATGNGITIADVLTNSDTLHSAKVTYIITPVGGICSGVPFKLTVNVSPTIVHAAFTADKTEGCGDLTVQFTNTTPPYTGATYVWDFGDGTHLNDVNPQHTFLAEPINGKDKIYHVTLSMQTDCGIAIPYPMDITVRPKTPVVLFTPLENGGCSPYTLTITNTSPGNNLSYKYYVYDKDTGALLVSKPVTTTTFMLDPLLAPVKTKVYNVVLEAVSFCGDTVRSIPRPITVSAANIIPDLFVNGQTTGCVPYVAQLVNASSGGDVYSYRVLNSDKKYYTSFDANAPGQTTYHTFTEPGTYYIIIVGTNTCNSAITSDSSRVSITVYPPPVADFTAPVTTGCKNVLVEFNNITQGDPDNQPINYRYQWIFGDGGTAAGYNGVTHTFNYKNSPYTVTLIATNPITGCSDTTVKKDFVIVTAPPGTNFAVKPDTVTSIPNYHFAFEDQTTGSPANWAWDFGDGKTDNGRNPSHTYADTGIYKVTLTTSTKDFCDSTISRHVRITGVPGELYLPNAFMPSSGTTELQTFIAKGSGIAKWHLQIYNNYGQLIWETSKLNGPQGTPVEGWDGTYKGVPQQQGVYIWQASATFINGSEWKGMTYNKSLPKRTGTINLIR